MPDPKISNSVVKISNNDCGKEASNVKTEQNSSDLKKNTPKAGSLERELVYAFKDFVEDSIGSIEAFGRWIRGGR